MSTTGETDTQRAKSAPGGQPAPTEPTARQSGVSSNQRDPKKEMPKWLIYGLVIKGIAVTLIVIGVLWWSGVF